MYTILAAKFNTCKIMELERSLFFNIELVCQNTHPPFA